MVWGGTRKPPADVQLVTYVGKSITCECSFLITQESLRWSEITEPSFLETLEDRFVGLVRDLIRELVSSTLINKYIERSVPQEKEVGLNDLVEPCRQSTLHLWTVVRVRKLHATLALSWDDQRNEF